MNEVHVLVVDDDPAVRKTIHACLEDEGFQVIEADDKASALEILRADHINLITLDLHLGQDDGLDIAREVRRISQVPIIIISGKNDVIDRIVGLELGADDYITKPFHLREFVARVRAILRRSSAQSAPQVSLGGLKASGEVEKALAGRTEEIRFDGMIAYPERFELVGRDGQICPLTSGDFKLLTVFLNNAKRVLSRDRLMDLIEGPEWTPMDRTIDNQVARLRKKIERDPTQPRLIKTVRGIGYLFAGDLSRGSGDSSD